MLELGVDVGGTFTDLVAIDERGRMTVRKVPTTPADPERGALEGMRTMFPRGMGGVRSLSHATTIATNALFGQMRLLLPSAALITTEGFRDVLRIGRGNRPRLYDLTARRPEALVPRERRWEVRERTGADGREIVPLDEEGVRELGERARKKGVPVIAVCLLNSHLDPSHERKVKAVLAGMLPSTEVIASHEVSPEHREYERTSTTVVNALLSPVMGDYLRRLGDGVGEIGYDGELYVLRSDGGLATASRAVSLPATMVESGPAAGVVAAAHLGSLLGEGAVLSFDMGGTTAKAGSILDHRPDLVNEYEVGGDVNVGRVLKGSGHPVRHRFIDLVECSAGGGSVAWVDGGGSLRVGPLSAGADPGPACYGKGENATITDANLVLGRLPHSLAGGLRLDVRRAEEALLESVCRPLDLDLHAAAEGIVRIADATMARILRIVSMERGRDPRDSALMAFGGGGPMHACSLAEELGMERVIVPPIPGLFSALGLLFASPSSNGEKAVMRPLERMEEEGISAILSELERGCLSEMGGEAEVERSADLRYLGQSFEVNVPVEGCSPQVLREGFEARHEQLYGHASGGEVELVNLRCTARRKVSPPPLRRPDGVSAAEAIIGSREVRWRGEWSEATVLGDLVLAPGEGLEGPAVVQGYDHTLLVPPGWGMTAEEHGCLVLRRRK